MTPEPQLEEEQTSRRVPLTIIGWGALLGVLLLVIVVAAHLLRPDIRPLRAPGDTEAIAPVVPQEITLPNNNNRDAKIGIIMTYGEDAEGSEWVLPAQGAAVAAHRLDLGKTPVQLTVANDKGTSDGARDAVEKLKSEGVQGIIISSSGEHIKGATNAARESSIPVIEVYDSVDTGRGVWSLAPNPEQLSQAYMQASQPSTQSIVIAPKDTEVNIPQVAAKHAYDRDTDVRELAQDVKKESQSYGASANIFVSGSAIRQAKIVKELQYAGVTAQILLSPQAVSPIFARTLVAEGGTVSANLTTVGYNMSDSLALQSDDPGRGLAAFLEAVRVMGQDSSFMTLQDDQAFKSAAPYADARSHNAVLAFAYAIDKVHERKPEAVTRVLESMRLDAAQAIAGDALDFTHENPTTAPVQTLHATEQSLGLRLEPSNDQEPRIVWFAERGTRTETYNE